MKWERGRGRRTALFVVGLMLLAMVSFLVLRSTDVFAVKRVVAVGADQVTSGQIEELTAGVMGTSMLTFSTRPMEEALLALPYVQTAKVRRGFPDTLEIELSEYEPVARLQTGSGSTLVVAGDGSVLEYCSGSTFEALPLVVPASFFEVRIGETVSAAVIEVLPLAVMLAREGLGAELPGLTAIEVSAGGCASLLLEGGGELRLGSPDSLEQKLGVALSIVRQCEAQDRVIEYVDASVVDRVAVKAK